MSSNENFGALIDRIIDMGLRFANGSVVDERTMCDAVLIAGSDLEGLDLFCEEFGELVVDAGLDVDPICADAGLA